MQVTADVPLRVLIVEDSSLFQRVLLSLIKGVPNASVVGQAYTAGEAIGAIEAKSPDIVLLDIAIPEGDGFSVLQAMLDRANPPVCMIVTFASEEPIRRRCRDLGCNWFFDKGDDAHSLLEVLRQLGSGEMSLAQLRKGPKRVLVAK